MKSRAIDRVHGARIQRIQLLQKRGVIMLYWAVVFLVIAIVAALFGFGGIATASAGIAKILFVVFLIVFIVALLFGLRGPRRL